jgi:4-amino-4-deoxy-L-arabinose transferase-like glycosyltransferase
VDRPGRLAEPLALGPRGRLALELGALALIVAAQVALLTRLLHSRTVFDEGVYLASLDALRHGAALGREVFTSQVPGFYVLLRGIGVFSGVSVSGVRLGIVAFDVVAIVFAWLLGRRLGGPLAGLLTAALIAVAPTLPEFGGRIYADPPAVALVMVSLWLAATRRAFAAGAFLAAALSVKLSAITAIPTALVLLALTPPRRRPLLVAAAGAAAVVAVLALVFVRDLGGIWDGAFAYHVDSKTAEEVNGAHQLRNLFSLRTPFTWIVVAGIVASVREWRRVWPLWLWPAATVLFVLTYHPLRDNHLIPVPYSFAVPAGIAIGLAARRLHGRALAVVCAAAALVLAAGWVQQLHRVDLGRGPEDPAILAAAARLGTLTSPGDLVVADQPIVAVLAHRQVPPSLVDTAKSRFLSGSLTDADVLRTIDGDPRVTAAVAGRAFSDRPELLAALRRRFAHETAFDSVVVLYGRKPA